MEIQIDNTRVRVNGREVHGLARWMVIAGAIAIGVVACVLVIAGAILLVDLI